MVKYILTRNIEKCVDSDIIVGEDCHYITGYVTSLDDARNYLKLDKANRYIELKDFRKRFGKFLASQISITANIREYRKEKCK